MARRRSYQRYWSRYVPVAERRMKAARLAAEHLCDGRELSPVEVAARRTIAKTFWGASWCENLERYSDYANRLPRGRTYVRNGSVIDLQIAPGQVTALVSGSDIYTVEIGVEQLAAARWRRLCRDCAGGIDSLVELLQGRFSKGVMEVLCAGKTGMFPEPDQISLRCSCPDWATMCKHVAAVLYGIGARLDDQPELLFELRQVDQTELITAGAGGIEVDAAGAADDALAGEDLGALFGIELEAPVAPSVTPGKARARKAPARKTPARKAARKAAKKAKARPKRDPWITAAELRARGVPPNTIQTWLRKGLLEHSGERGIYARTDASEALVREHAGATPPAKRRARRRSPAPELIGAQELLQQGVTRTMIQRWLQRGVLGRTPKRGVYALTEEARSRIMDRA